METSISGAFESLFGCHHRHLSRVFTIKPRTYRVCLDCAQRFDYSWELMHSTRPGAPCDVAACARPTEVAVSS